MPSSNPDQSRAAVALAGSFLLMPGLMAASMAVPATISVTAGATVYAALAAPAALQAAKKKGNGE